MSPADCTRWIELSDHAAMGEALSDRDQAWLAHHARGCSACSREAGFYVSLHEAVGRPEALVLPATTARPVAKRRRARTAVLASAALAAAVALVVGLVHLRAGRAPVSVTVPAPTLTAHVLLASGEARLGKDTAKAGQLVGHGERIGTDDGITCAAIAGSITVCLDAQSTATLALSDPKRAVVYLEKGRLLARLDHQPLGRTFLVRTAQAEVQAVGTRFSVGVSKDGQTHVRLHEGKVAVRSANHVQSDLAAPEEAQVADDIRVGPMPSAGSRDDAMLSDLSTLPRAESAATVHILSDPPGADVMLGNVAMGKTPLSTVLVADAHLRLTMEGHVPVSEWISVADGASIERTFTLTAEPSEPSEGPRQRPASAHRHDSPSPSQLLAKAQALRANGAYDACAGIYRRLWLAFPSSEEAKVSMISLGELELGKRNRPAAALEAFGTYLRMGGPLEREARFGKIRALRALGREREAASESTTFLRDYPTGSQAATLRRQAHEE